jgi:arginine decarboxylase
VGVFLIGAYQEALSDDHNLMGNFHVIIVSAEGEIEILEGATTMEVLHHVHHCREELIGSLNDSIETAAREKGISRTEESEIRLFFNEVMRSYTYLAPNQVKQSQRLPESHFLAESLALNK